MGLQTSGQISLNDVRTYLAGLNAIESGTTVSLNNGGIRHIANNGIPYSVTTSGQTLSMSNLYDGKLGCAPGVLNGNTGAGLITCNINETTYGSGDGVTSVSLTANYDVYTAIYSIKWLVVTPTSGGGSSNFATTNLSGGTSGSSSISYTFTDGAGTYVFRCEAYNSSNGSGTMIGNSGANIEFCRQVSYVNNTTGNGILLDGGGLSDGGTGYSDTEYTISATAGPTGSPTVSLTGPWGTETGSGSASVAYTFSPGSYTVTGSASGYGSRSISFTII